MSVRFRARVALALASFLAGTALAAPPRPAIVELYTASHVVVFLQKPGNGAIVGAQTG